MNPQDVQITIYDATPRGGMRVCLESSVVTAYHLPSKLGVTVGTERSQHANKEKALRILASLIPPNIPEVGLEKSQAISDRGAQLLMERYASQDDYEFNPLCKCKRCTGEGLGWIEHLTKRQSQIRLARLEAERERWIEYDGLTEPRGFYDS